MKRIILLMLLLLPGEVTGGVDGGESGEYLFADPWTVCDGRKYFAVSMNPSRQTANTANARNISGALYWTPDKEDRAASLMPFLHHTGFPKWYGRWKPG